MDYEGRHGAQGDFGSSNLVPDNAAATAAAGRPGEIVLLPSAANAVVLPEGASLDDIHVRGRDLVIDMPDGRVYVIPEGAIYVPEIVIDDVAVPPLNLAALLIGQEPAPAAGVVQSSGGNFADPLLSLQGPYGLGDLLPYTELAFPEQREPEHGHDVLDRQPDVEIEAGGPATHDALSQAHEAGLLAARAGTIKSPGSSAGDGSNSTSGTIIITAADGLKSVTINGITLTGEAGQQIVTDKGTLVLGAMTGNQITYVYTLQDNTSGDDTTDKFVVTVTDKDGDTAQANLTIQVIDDVATARNDTDNVPDGALVVIDGNVITGENTTSGAAGADTLGADGGAVTDASIGDGEAEAFSTLAVTGARAGDVGLFLEPGMTVQGQYGVLTIEANGLYHYARLPGSPGGVTDTFSYELTDGDGDTSTATLVISIGDSNVGVSVPTTREGTSVDEAGLPARGDEPAGSQSETSVEMASGTINIVAPDGIASVKLNATEITEVGQQIALPSGIFTVTGYDPDTGTLSYTFVLTDNTSGDNVREAMIITVTDTDGDTAIEPFIVSIIDDVPTARDDSAGQTAENAPVTVDVFANDTSGADGVDLATGVALVPGSLTGSGTLVRNDNGTFTYTPATGDGESVSFQYTITDGDGDTSTATVTIALQPDSTPSLELSGDNAVAEAGLPARGGEPAGSDAASSSEVATGTIAIATGGDTIGTLVIEGVDVTNGGTVTGTSGTLVVSRSGSTYSYTYTLTDNTSGDATTDSFHVVVTDSDGSIASDDLVIAIVDDVPTAAADTDSIAAGQYGPATGNVITDAEGDGGSDVRDADGAVVTAISGSSVGTIGGTTVGLYGSLTLEADGSYSYARHPGTPGGVSDVFNYTIKDGDGDESSATLTINIADGGTTLDLPTQGSDGTIVAEAGLSNGSAAETDAEITSGVFHYTAPDGPGTVSIGGVAVTAAGQTFTGSFGTLVIDSIADGEIRYTYTLTTNTAGDATADAFAVTVTDADGDSSTGTLTIAIIDDVPVASDDGIFTVAEGTPLTINVLANDTQGADGVNPAIPGSVSIVDAPTKGTVSYNSDGTFTYTAANGAEGPDSFTYRIVDQDGDASTATVTLNLEHDSVPTLISTTDLVVDEDGLATANADSGQLDPTELNFTESRTAGGTAVVNFGSDVPVNLTNSIVLLDAAALDGQVKTLSGADVTFALQGGALVGSSGGTEVLRITVTGATAGPAAGDVTYNYQVQLSQPVKHAVSGSEDSIVLSGVGFTVTDSDGDPVSGSFNVTIVDDVPTIDIAAGAAKLVVDESVGTAGSVLHEGGAANNDETAAGAALGAIGYAKGVLVTTLTADAGADGQASRVYSLSVSNAPSGLVDAQTNETVVLSLNAGVVEGRISGGRLVFTLSVDPATGEATLNQFRAVEHNDSTNHDESGASAAGLASGTISLGVTLTDGDGDKASDTADISGLIKFEDDGPSVTISASGAGIVHDETPGVQSDSDVTGPLGVAATNPGDDLDVAGTGPIGYAKSTVALSGTADLGSDGGSSVISLTLSQQGVDSGLDTSEGANIYLFKEGDVVVGRVGGQGGVAAFAIDIESDGKLGMVQYLSIKHPTGGTASSDETVHISSDVLFATNTATDGDGDTAAASISIGQLIGFQDDGPAAIGETRSVGTTTLDLNVAFVLDFSSSINDGELNIQLDAVRAAGQQLFQNTTGAVSIDVVLFASSAKFVGEFTSEADFVAAINGLNPAEGGARPGGIGGNTNFSAGLETAMQNFQPNPNASNLVFFLSDGNPNEPSGINTAHPLSNGTAAKWNTFVDTNFINVTTIGVGNDIQNGPLQAVDVDGQGAPILVANFDDIITALLATALPPPISGNALSNGDGFGSDGGQLSSVTFDGKTYTWDSATNVISISSGGTISGSELVNVVTTLGGKFSFSFTGTGSKAAGDWSYVAPANVNGTPAEHFTYALTDKDGDTASATLDVHLVENAAPHSNGPSAVSVSEEGLPGALPDTTGTPDTTNSTTASGTVSFTDASPLTISLGAPVTPLSSLGVPLTWTGAGTQTLTGYAGSTAIIKVTINNAGNYTVTLLGPVDQPKAAVEGAINLVVPVAASDGLSATLSKITISIEDDRAALAQSAGDRVITNVSGANGAIVISEAALQFNDAAGVTITGNPIFVVDAASVTRGNGSFTFVDDGDTNGGTFGYAVGSALSDVALVTVDREQAGWNTLTGTAANEILIGRDNAADTLNGNAGHDYLIAEGGNDVLNGGAGNDVLLGGTGSDTLTGGTGADTMTGGADADRFVIAAGDSTVTIGGSGNAGTISGFDRITDFNSSVDTLDLPGTAIAAANAVVNGADSTLTVGGATIKSHSITNGVISFDDANNFSSALSLTSDAHVAAAVQYLRGNDLGNAGVTVAFTAGGRTFVYEQVGNSPSAANDTLVELQGVNITNLNTLIGSRVAPVVLDLDGDGVEFHSHAAGVTFDYSGDGRVELTGWAGNDDGLLAFDRNGDGIITDGSEIVFGGDGLTDLQGIAASYDGNGDGVLDAQDAAFAKFGVWQDANANGATDEGEFHSLTDLGIVRIGLTSDGAAQIAGDGDVIVHGTGIFTRADGTTGSLADASFVTAELDRMAARTAEMTATTVAAVGALLATAAAAATNDAPPALPASDVGGHADSAAADPADVQAQDPASLEPSQAAQLLGVPANENKPEEKGSSHEAEGGEDHATAITAPVDHDAGSQHDAAVNDDDAGGSVSQAPMPDFASHGGGAALMDALLTAAGKTPVVAENAPAPDAGTPLVHEVVADAAAENFIDKLLDQLAGASSDKPQASGDHPHEGLLAALGGQVSGSGAMPGGFDVSHIMDHAIDHANAAAAAAA